MAGELLDSGKATENCYREKNGGNLWYPEQWDKEKRGAGAAGPPVESRLTGNPAPADKSGSYGVSTR